MAVMLGIGVFSLGNRAVVSSVVQLEVQRCQQNQSVGSRLMF